MLRVTIYFSMLVCFSLLGGCSNEVSVGSNSATRAPGLCQIDLEEKRQAALAGDIDSARTLRAYFELCKEDKSSLAYWAESAAVRGDHSDEQEYLQILLEGRFKESGYAEWTAPNCDAAEPVGASVGNGPDLAHLHLRISYLATCTSLGISEDLLSTALRASMIGKADDRAFHQTISRVATAKQRPASGR